MQADVRPHMARGITFHGRSNSALRLRATLRVDEKYAADPTSATYRTVSPRARVIQASFWLAWDHRRKGGVQISEQPRKVKNEAIPEWAEGLYYNKGLFSEVLVYHDDESIYFEHRGKESGIVRFTFEMVEGLKIVEDEGEEQADSTE